MGAMALLGTLALAGCAPPTPQTPSPTATDAPVFASDAEALAAATEAFAAYDSMTAVIGSEGGRTPERIQPFATAEYYQDLIAGFKRFSSSGNSSEGASSFDTVSLISHTEKPGQATVEIYLCSDVSSVRLHDLKGADVTPLDRPNRVPLQVVLISNHELPTKLLISEENVWQGENFCLV